MRNTILILCILALSGCTNQSKKQSDESEETAFVLDSTIRIGDAIEKALPSMKLSEVVDSIVYVPLETKIYLTNGLLQYVKPYWCAYPGHLFDAKGKYVKHIGKNGGGPGEENGPWGYMVTYDEKRGLFYTQGNKIIQYDRNGKFTGVEKTIQYTSGGMISGGSLTGLAGMVTADSLYMLVNYPDSAYWVNTNLEILHKERILLDDSLYQPKGLYVQGVQYGFSDYDGHTLFYNFFNDCVYTVTDKGLKERWKFDMKDLGPDKRALLNDYMMQYRERSQIARAANGNEQTMKLMAENGEYARRVNNKKRILNAYESERYVVMQWTNMIAHESMRKKYSPYLLAFLDKTNGNTFAISEHLTDDIDGGKPFELRLGVHNGAMVSWIWPYELKEYIAQQKEKGEWVSEKLVAFADGLKEDDNPVLIMAYLKKK